MPGSARGRRSEGCSSAPPGASRHQVCGDTLPPLTARERSADRTPREHRGKRQSEQVRPFEEVIDEEINKLREKLEVQTRKTQEIKDGLAMARCTEFKVKREASEKMVECTKRSVCANKIQTAMRTFLSCRKFAVRWKEYMETKQVETVTLQDQLQALQHKMHDLVFRATNQSQVVVLLQSWWRMILGKRVAHMMLVNSKMRYIQRVLLLSIFRIQRWYRATLQRRTFMHRIRTMMSISRQRAKHEMECKIMAVTRLQRGLRRYIALKRVQQRKTRFLAPSSRGRDDRDTVFHSSLGESDRQGWLGGSRRGGGSSPRARAKDRELEKLEDAGLAPFYWASSNQRVRHKIGGPKALKLLGARPDGEPPIAVAGVGALGGQGELWDVYPEGISPGFTEGLDDDLWPADGPCRRQPAPGRRRAGSKRARRRCHKPPPPTKPVPHCIPQNSIKRASAREERRQSTEPAELVEGEAGGDDARGDLTHPLLCWDSPYPINAPSPGAEERVERPAKRAQGARPTSDDEGWGGFTGFYAETPPSSPERRRSRGRRAGAPEGATAR